MTFVMLLIDNGHINVRLLKIHLLRLEAFYERTLFTHWNKLGCCHRFFNRLYLVGS